MLIGIIAGVLIVGIGMDLITRYKKQHKI